MSELRGYARRAFVLFVADPRAFHDANIPGSLEGVSSGLLVCSRRSPRAESPGEGISQGYYKIDSATGTV